jgi:putative Mg2+ transporter-C (MgtC) family protein
LLSFTAALRPLFALQITGFENLFDAATLGSALSTLIRLGIAVVLGGLIGVERELTKRPAGVRTHMLVCLGCCLFTEVSRAFVSPNPDRVAAQILTGVGFLGAGTIMRTGLDIKGLTTAASIWSVAAIGMSVSLGGAFLWVAIAATVLTLATLRFVTAFEERFIPRNEEHTLIVTLDSQNHAPAILSALESVQAAPTRVEFEKREVGTLMKLTLDSEKGVLEAITPLPEVISAVWADER